MNDRCDDGVPARALVILGLLAVALRLPGLERSLWYDELFTLQRFTGSARAAVASQVAANNHPLASLLTWLHALVWGPFAPDARGAVALRLPFAVCGALAAPALAWALGRRDRRVGLVAGALLALSPTAVLYSQQVRGYALLLPLGALVLGATFAASEDPTRRRVLLLAGATALGVWGHATFLLLALPLLALAARPGAPERPALKGLALGTLLGGLLCLPVASRLFKFARGALWTEPAGALHPGPLSPFAVLELLGGGSSASTAALTLLVGVGLAHGVRRPEQRSLTVVLAAPLLGGLGFLLLRPLGYPRFLLVLLPSLLGLAALGLVALAAPAPRRRAAAAVLLALVALPAAWSLGVQRTEELMDYRGALRVAVERARELRRPYLFAVGVGGELFAGIGPPRATHDVDGNLLCEALLDGKDAIAIVPLPGWLERVPDLRRVLYGDSFAAPLVLPGREGPVLVFATRTLPAQDAGD